jgi:hypothetical protein
MTRKALAFALAALFAAPVFAETGVGIGQIDNVANIYGRASAPNVRISGAVSTGHSDVNVAGRQAGPFDAESHVVNGARTLESHYGRS